MATKMTELGHLSKVDLYCPVLPDLKHYEEPNMSTGACGYRCGYIGTATPRKVLINAHIAKFACKIFESHSQLFTYYGCLYFV